MPHVNTGGSQDFFSDDEVKVYKDEGEEEKRSSENLSEDKLGLVTETEEGKGSFTGNEKSDRNRPEDGKPVQSQGDRDGGPFGYMPGAYPFPNGASVPSTLRVIPPPFWIEGGKMPMASPLGLMMYNNEPFSSPPPAHMGIPPVTLDPKTEIRPENYKSMVDFAKALEHANSSTLGFPRHAMYAYPAPHGQFPPSLYSSDVQWQRPPGYPLTSGALSGPYPTSLSSSGLRFPPGMFPPHGFPHPGMPYPAGLVPKGEGISQPLGQDNHRHGSMDQGSAGGSQGNPNQEPEKKKQPHIKKPLNAFMLFMKEQRAKVVAECTLKESAAINQILGRKWHALDRSEQAKYYEMARKEKELHLQLYPGWSARDNYACHAKKKQKRKKETCLADKECTNPKKCRARFGMEQQNQWCKPCRSLHEQSCDELNRTITKTEEEMH